MSATKPSCTPTWPGERDKWHRPSRDTRTSCPSVAGHKASRGSRPVAVPSGGLWLIEGLEPRDLFGPWTSRGGDVWGGGGFPPSSPVMILRFRESHFFCRGFCCGSDRTIIPAGAPPRRGGPPRDPVPPPVWGHRAAGGGCQRLVGRQHFPHNTLVQKFHTCVRSYITFQSENKHASYASRNTIRVVCFEGGAKVYLE